MLSSHELSPSCWCPSPNPSVRCDGVIKSARWSLVMGSVLLTLQPPSMSVARSEVQPEPRTHPKWLTVPALTSGPQPSSSGKNL